MNADKLKHYRQRLLDELDNVSTEIEQHLEISDPEVDTAVVNSEDNLRQKIELALQRIEQGSYGTCMGCGKTISTSRLDAKPSVSLCTDCQESKERK